MPIAKTYDQTLGESRFRKACINREDALRGGEFLAGKLVAARLSVSNGAITEHQFRDSVHWSVWKTLSVLDMVGIFLVCLGILNFADKRKDRRKKEEEEEMEKNCWRLTRK